MQVSQQQVRTLQHPLQLQWRDTHSMWPLLGRTQIRRLGLTCYGHTLPMLWPYHHQLWRPAWVLGLVTGACCRSSSFGRVLLAPTQPLAGRGWLSGGCRGQGRYPLQQAGVLRKRGHHLHQSLVYPEVLLVPQDHCSTWGRCPCIWSISSYQPWRFTSEQQQQQLGTVGA